jgi:hypothetical protein
MAVDFTITASRISTIAASSMADIIRPTIPTTLIIRAAASSTPTTARDGSAAIVTGIAATITEIDGHG